MPIDNDALLKAIDAAKTGAYGSDQATTLGITRSDAIDAYLGLNTKPAPEGRSQVVDRSVYETISTILPALVRIFVSSNEEICKCMPVGPDDEDAADQMTGLLNHVVTAQNPWEQICADWIHDSCLLSNGYSMAYWDASERLIREKYEGQSDDQITALMQEDDLTVLQHTAEIDKQATKEAAQQYQQMMQHWVQAVPILQQQGQPIPPRPQPPQPVMLHDVTIERRENAGKVCIKVLAPEHCYVDSMTPSWTLDECGFFEYQERTTIADLRAQGLDVPDDVSDQETPEFFPEDVSRDRLGERGLRALGSDEGVGVMRTVTARMIWVKANAEGDDQSRMYYVLAVGRTILYAEPVSRISVVSLTPQPLPHRHMGMSIAEVVKDIQDIRTAITRGGLDNMYLANAGRHAISDRVNLADYLDARPGGAVRMTDGSMPDGHIVPLTHPVIFDQTISTLAYFDQVRQDRTGASRTFSGTDPKQQQQTATGTIVNQNQSSYRVEHIARMMAPAVEGLFNIVQELIQKHQNKAITIKLRGQWTTIDPQAWRTKRDIRISVGVGAGNRDSMFAQLESIFQKQMAVLPMGLAGPEQLHATVIEQAKLAGFANGAKFWIDPTGKPPMPPPPDPAMIQAETAKQLKQMDLTADAQKFQAQSAQEMQRIQAEAETNRQAKATELTVQAANDERDAQREQYKAQLDAHVRALEVQATARTEAVRLELDKYIADLDAQVRLTIGGKLPQSDVEILQETLISMGATMQQLMADMNAPATIIRDKVSGKAIGVKRGSATRAITVGPDGRPTGLQ